MALPKFKIANDDDGFRPISISPALSSFAKQLTKDQVLQTVMRISVSVDKSSVGVVALQYF